MPGNRRIPKGLTRIAAALALLAAATAAAAPPPAEDQPAQITPEPLMGGSAGTRVSVTCDNHRVLVGVTGKAGSWLNNIFLKCAAVSGATLSDVKTLNYTYQRIGGMCGVGCHDYTVQCPSGQVVKGVMVYRGGYVNQIGLYCRGWDGTGWTGTGNLVGPKGGTGGTYDRRDCDRRTQPVVGLVARAGWWVDALGIRCDEP